MVAELSSTGQLPSAGPRTEYGYSSPLALLLLRERTLRRPSQAGSRYFKVQAPAASGDGTWAYE